MARDRNIHAPSNDPEPMLDDHGATCNACVVLRAYISRVASASSIEDRLTMQINSAPAWGASIQFGALHADSMHCTRATCRLIAWIRIVIVAALSSLLSSWVWAAAPVTSPSPGSQGMPISSISLERSCVGCAGSSFLLMLRRDGSATLTVTGNARQGVADTISTGRVAQADFDSLVQLVIEQGFFDLKDNYEDALIQDGEWSTTSVSRGSTEKRVFRRNDSAPLPLTVIEAAIEGVRARIAFHL